MTLSKRYRILAALCLLAAAGVGYRYRFSILETATHVYTLLTDREQVKALIGSAGVGAPLLFIAIQIAQVLLAPIPGEATGFIGGYLFGAFKGFIYSSIGLTAGSWLNFVVGRFFGKKIVRRMVSADKLARFDHSLRHRGVVVIFILFVIPGFPKDYLCLFLGLASTLPLKAFVLLAAVGRMPGTLMLSLQGALLFDRNYAPLAIIAGGSLLLVFFTLRYREAITRWIERLNGRKEDDN